MRSVDVDGSIDSHDLFWQFVNGSTSEVRTHPESRPELRCAGVWIRLPPEDRLVLQQLSSRQDVGVP